MSQTLKVRFLQTDGSRVLWTDTVHHFCNCMMSSRFFRSVLLACNSLLKNFRNVPGKKIFFTSIYV